MVIFEHRSAACFRHVSTGAQKIALCRPSGAKCRSVLDDRQPLPLCRSEITAHALEPLGAQRDIGAAAIGGIGVTLEQPRVVERADPAQRRGRRHRGGDAQARHRHAQLRDTQLHGASLPAAGPGLEGVTLTGAVMRGRERTRAAGCAKAAPSKVSQWPARRSMVAASNRSAL